MFLVAARRTENFFSSGWVPARDVAFQLLDVVLLTGDDPFDQIANGEHADHAVALHNGKMANAVIGHDGHAFIDGVLAGDENDWAGHDPADWSLLRLPALENDLAGVVAFRENADQLAIRDHQQRADSMLRHLLDGLVDRLLGTDRQNGLAGLLCQKGVDFVSKAHGGTLRVVTPCAAYLTTSGQVTADSELQPEDCGGGSSYGPKLIPYTMAHFPNRSPV